MIRSLAHVCIRSTDLEKTLVFYCGVLGMEKVFDFTKQGEVIGFYLRGAAETFIEVFRAEVVEGTSVKSALGHFCLETEDMPALRRRISENGYEPTPIQLGADQSYQFWVKDVGGVDIEFHQYSEESAQFTRQAVEVDW